MLRHLFDGNHVNADAAPKPSGLPDTYELGFGTTLSTAVRHQPGGGYQARPGSLTKQHTFRLLAEIFRWLRGRHRPLTENGKRPSDFRREGRFRSSGLG
jgi:hypothetical protein